MKTLLTLVAIFFAAITFAVGVDAGQCANGLCPLRARTVRAAAVAPPVAYVTPTASPACTGLPSVLVRRTTLWERARLRRDARRASRLAVVAPVGCSGIAPVGCSGN